MESLGFPDEEGRLPLAWRHMMYGASSRKGLKATKCTLVRQQLFVKPLVSALAENQRGSL